MLVLFELLTPSDPEQRGAQLSIKFLRNTFTLHEELEKRGIVVSGLLISEIILFWMPLILIHTKCDYREPNVLRFAPAPLYNNFNELFRFVKILAECIELVDSKMGA